MDSSFTCIHCGKSITSQHSGVQNRNHCPYCLYSKHVDDRVGDRKSLCGGEMKPIGVTFKRLKNNNGELMLIHKCEKCGKLSINRIAADDDIELIQKAFEDSVNLTNQEKEELTSQGIIPAGEEDREEVKIQLFGK